MSVASRILILLLCSSFAGAEDLMVTLAGRPVGTVRVLGGTDSDTRFALNNLRSLAGSPLDAAIVRADIRRLTELGRFSEVVAKVTERPDGAVDLVYRVVLAPIIRSVEVQGNRRLGSEEILNRVPRLLGSIRDEALLERAARDVELWMRGEGYLESRVEFTSGDRPENLILLVSEGPRAKVRSVRFRGNSSMRGDRLQQLVEVQPAILLLESGTLDESKL
ncbi:MAG: POTRA domain-containing protein, partial [Planctomycetota bacterium]|nr:POTRA domain-containing protein [Planctomycetota bacterium]